MLEQEGEKSLRRELEKVLNSDYCFLMQGQKQAIVVTIPIRPTPWEERNIETIIEILHDNDYVEGYSRVDPIEEMELVGFVKEEKNQGSHFFDRK